MQSTVFLLGYIGPDLIPPVASTVAAILGGMLIFGRNIWHAFGGACRRWKGRE